MKERPVLSYIWLLVTSFGCIGAALTPFTETETTVLTTSCASLFILAIYLFAINRRRLKRLYHLSTSVLTGEAIFTIVLFILLLLNIEGFKNCISEHENLFHWLIWGLFYITLPVNLFIAWKQHQNQKSKPSHL